MQDGQPAAKRQRIGSSASPKLPDRQPKPAPASNEVQPMSTHVEDGQPAAKREHINIPASPKPANRKLKPASASAEMQSMSAHMQDGQPAAKRQRIDLPASTNLPVSKPKPAPGSIRPGLDLISPGPNAHQTSKGTVLAHETSPSSRPDCNPAAAAAAAPEASGQPDGPNQAGRASANSSNGPSLPDKSRNLGSLAGPAAHDMRQSGVALPPLNNGAKLETAGPVHVAAAGQSDHLLNEGMIHGDSQPEASAAGMSSDRAWDAAAQISTAEGNPETSAEDAAGVRGADGLPDEEASTGEGGERPADGVKQEAEEEVATGVVERATKAVATAIGCDICGDVMRDPVTAPECMHSFCAACIDEYIFDLQVSCPLHIHPGSIPVNGALQSPRMYRHLPAVRLRSSLMQH